MSEREADRVSRSVVSGARRPGGEAAKSGEVSERSWHEWAEGTTCRLHDAQRWRAPRAFEPGPDAVSGDYEGRRVVSFASNDYLGLTHHPDVVAAAHAALDRYGAGSGSARLIVGARTVHEELEHELAAWKQEASAVVFPTGFAANIGTLAAFGGPGTLVCSDELNHASIIDGCRLARADVAVYRHRDLDELAKLLETRGPDRRAIVVSDSVFSMDGDLADLDLLVGLCAEHGALLVLDEAHAVMGPHPDPAALASVAHVRVGTLSKTLGALGGFVAGPRLFTDLLVNLARSYIFTTAPTPADAAAALAAVRVLRSPAGDALVAHLTANVARLAPTARSPIIPVMCGTDEAALAAASALLDQGFLVPAIRPPTVAPGTARLRIACSAAHTGAQVDGLRAALDDAGLATGLRAERPQPSYSATRSRSEGKPAGS